MCGGVGCSQRHVSIASWSILPMEAIPIVLCLLVTATRTMPTTRFLGVVQSSSSVPNVQRPQVDQYFFNNKIELCDSQNIKHHISFLGTWILSHSDIFKRGKRGKYPALKFQPSGFQNSLIRAASFRIRCFGFDWLGNKII